MDILEDNESFLFWRERNVICLLYKDKIIDLDIAKMSVFYSRKVADNKTSVMYIDMSHIKYVTKEARDYLSKSDPEEKVKAVGVLTTSVLTKIIATFFLNFNKPPMPYRMFTNKDKAMEWLCGFDI